MDSVKVVYIRLYQSMVREAKDTIKLEANRRDLFPTPEVFWSTSPTRYFEFLARKEAET